jgi:hypothetical protein
MANLSEYNFRFIAVSEEEIDESLIVKRNGKEVEEETERGFPCKFMC